MTHPIIAHPSDRTPILVHFSAQQQTIRCCVREIRPNQLTDFAGALTFAGFIATLKTTFWSLTTTKGRCESDLAPVSRQMVRFCDKAILLFRSWKEGVIFASKEALKAASWRGCFWQVEQLHLESHLQRNGGCRREYPTLYIRLFPLYPRSTCVFEYYNFLL